MCVGERQERCAEGERLFSDTPEVNTVARGDWPRLSLSLSVSIKSRLSPQGCLPRAHILPTDLLAISVANGPAIPVNDVVPLSKREREKECV